MTTRRPSGPALPGGQLLIYRDGALNLRVRLDGQTVWLTQRMIADLYQVSVKTVNEHLVNIYDEQELEPEATIRKFRIVQLEGNRKVTRTLDHYNLDAILAVGYRVRSNRGTQFRQWATARLKELLVKGFTLDDERIKAGRTIGQDYFDELLERIRDIRASERLFYQKITDIYATSIDYDPKTDISQTFFATVQNKLHWAIHGHTAAEIIAQRADAARPHMGLTTWKNAPDGPIRKTDVTIAKNYLSEAEIKELNRVVTMYLDYAEDQARRRKPMHMADWIAKLDAFLQFNERNILTHAGMISHELATEHAEGEFEKYRAEQRRLEAERPTSDFDKAVEGVKRIEQEQPKEQGGNREAHRPNVPDGDARGRKMRETMRDPLVETMKRLRTTLREQRSGVEKVDAASTAKALDAGTEGKWRTVALERLIDPDRGISYGIVQPGSPVSDGVPIVRVRDVRDGRIATADPLRVSRAIEAAYSRTRLVGGELLLTLVGTVGEAAIVPESLAGWNTARAVAVIPVRKKIGSYWVQIALRSPAAREIMYSRLNTTVQVTLNLRDVAQLPIVLPPQREREAIAHILGTLDDKIELNRQMNETLEAMARALFKSWFVDFDPVRAEAEGGDPGLPAEIAGLFPDSFEDSELGKIPKGWEVGSLLDQAQLLSGGTPKTDRPEYWDGGVPWTSAKDVSQIGDCFVTSTERTITERGLLESATQIVPAFSTVVVARGATTGRMAMLGSDMAMNQTCYALRSTLDCNFALYCQARHVMHDLVYRAHGSIFNTITTATFQTSRFVLAPYNILRQFENAVEPIFRQVLVKTNESRTLSALRDTLLPKLLSGEIRIKDMRSSWR